MDIYILAHVQPKEERRKEAGFDYVADMEYMYINVEGAKFFRRKTAMV